MSLVCGIFTGLMYLFIIVKFTSKTKLIYLDVLYDYVKQVRKLSDFVDEIWVKIVNEDWKNITDMDSLDTSSNLFYGAYCFTLKNDFAKGMLAMGLMFKPVKVVKSVKMFFPRHFKTCTQSHT